MSYQALNKNQKRRYDICVRDCWHCWYCGADLSRFEGDFKAFKDVKVGAPTLDHLLPKVRGGSEDWSNLVCCCWDCNVTKGGKTVEEYRRYLAYHKTKIRKAVRLLDEAIKLWPTPFDIEIKEAMAWIQNQAPVITFYGETSNQEEETSNKRS